MFNYQSCDGAEAVYFGRHIEKKPSLPGCIRDVIGKLNLMNCMFSVQLFIRGSLIMLMCHPAPICFYSASKEYLHDTGCFGLDTEVGEMRLPPIRYCSMKQQWKR